MIKNIPKQTDFFRSSVAIFSYFVVVVDNNCKAASLFKIMIEFSDFSVDNVSFYLKNKEILLININLLSLVFTLFTGQMLGKHCWVTRKIFRKMSGFMFLG